MTDLTTMSATQALIASIAAAGVVGAATLLGLLLARLWGER